ncbi:hypothetical protein BR93DRAFT_924440 [Coniochaeta sp. PMI_546]|nr:hypothetical protein BR93DRAFT_924440 [Coniochaeta sp. PMI_546]
MPAPTTAESVHGNRSAGAPPRRELTRLKMDDLIPEIRSLIKELDELPNEVREVQLAQLDHSQRGAFPNSVADEGSEVSGQKRKRVNTTISSSAATEQGACSSNDIKYDKSTQAFFSKLVSFTSIVGNRIRRAKRTAERAQTLRLAGLDCEDFQQDYRRNSNREQDLEALEINEDPETAATNNEGSMPLLEPSVIRRALSNGRKEEVNVFTVMEKHLKSVQTLGEKAAFDVLCHKHCVNTTKIGEELRAIEELLDKISKDRTEEPTPTVGLEAI